MQVFLVLQIQVLYHARLVVSSVCALCSHETKVFDAANLVVISTHWLVNVVRVA